jgi:ABC-type dipeptide/oligopeptide/nickel transport system permease component
MRVYEYVIRRLALMIFVLFGVSAIVFYLARGFPSAFAPWAQYITYKMRPEQINAIIKAHGFDQPLYLQYWYWLVDVFHGDWGFSNWANGLPTYTVFASRFPFTVELTITATIMTLMIGIPLGILSALKNNTAPDHASRIIALTGYSTPAYWFGYILQLVFFYYFYTWGLPNLPSGGVISQNLSGTVPAVTGLPILDGIIAGNLTYTTDALAHVILPAFNLSFISLGYLARIVRASMLEVLRQDFIIMARSKGLAERTVIYRHALRNAMIPAMTLTGLFFAGLLGGAMITETVFSWPGVGNVSLRAVFQGDSNFLLLYSLVTALIIVVANLVVDVLYVFLDPRIKY